MLNRTSYTGLTYLLAPVALARLVFLSRKNPGYRQNLAERFGYLGEKTFSKNTLWIHAVSVGEVIASESLVSHLLEKYPQLHICMTTMTPTGRDQVKRSFGHWGNRLQPVYAPYDLPDSIFRFLKFVSPTGLVIMETELWPNWIEACKEKSLPVVLANGRLSEKSLAGYQKLNSLSHNMLKKIGLICAQTEDDAERFRSLGAANIHIAGNMKADFSISDKERASCEKLKNIFALKNPKKVLIAASTHPGEEEFVIAAFKSLWQKDSSLRLILVPRHPDRAEDIARLLSDKGVGFKLRSGELPLDEKNPVALCDKLGELRALYGLAKIAFIGGTIVDHGGHNPLEPAAWEMAMIAGPSQRNFSLIFDALEGAGAMRRVSGSAEELGRGIQMLLEDASQVETMGIAAKKYLDTNRGATLKNVRLIEESFQLSV